MRFLRNVFGMEFSTLDFYANYSRKRKKDNAGKNAKGRENEIIL